MTTQEYHWKLVDSFVKIINNYRALNFSPSDLITVDESIIRWYGQGGKGINHGLPCYVAIDRKFDNRCETQNAACGRNGIMLQLNIVKNDDEENGETEDGGELLHGAIVLWDLVYPWANTGRVVCSDS